MKYGYGFTYRGKHSSDFGLFVKTTDNVMLPPRNQTRFIIPDRSGEFVFDGEPSNKILSLLLTLTMPESQLSQRRFAVRQIAGWLSGKGSLVFDYEPNLRYEVVSTVNSVSTDIGKGYDTFNVSFECEPYQYGEKREYSETSFFASNNGTAPSDTLISISGFGAVTATAGNQNFVLSAISDTVIVDSRRMAVYLPNSQSMTHIHSGGFIKIPVGGIPIEFSGNITAVTTEYLETWL